MCNIHNFAMEQEKPELMEPFMQVLASKYEDAEIYVILDQALNRN